MLRTLLALFLAVAATGAVGAEVLPADAETPQCEKESNQGSKSNAGGTAAARPGTPPSVRPRSASGRSTPRWHSMLPGMIR